MPELLLELFSEEIPARMQVRAADDLKKSVTDALAKEDVFGEAAKAFATPRRLTLVITGLPARQQDRKDERKGPRVGAPEKAMAGFLKSTGLTLDQCETRKDKKGEYYVAVIEKVGRGTDELIAEIVPKVVRNFPWPKSMRWGNGSLRWVRPLHSIVCTFDGEVVPFEIGGIRSGNVTYGHRFMGPDAITVREFDDYVAKLERQKVMLDGQDRAAHILEDAKNLAHAQNLELIDDEALVHEVAGLVEWPTTFMGSIDEEFMSIPQEVLTSTMRANQKYFALRDPKTGALAPRFIVVSNIEPEDGGAAVVNGNERVLRARFADARFLWDEDKTHTLEDFAKKLDQVVFHAKLGTVAEKSERISRLAGELAAMTGADKAQAELAGRLCKADLVSGMVFEFPDLQGTMGRYYAQADGLGADVADAIAQHYQPQGPSDDVPRGPVAQAVALADKFDTLASFWVIDEKPTGSKDPFALRRAALGCLRTILDNHLRISLMERFLFPIRRSALAKNVARQEFVKQSDEFDIYDGSGRAPAEFDRLAMEATELGEKFESWAPADEAEMLLLRDLLSFFADRLKIYLRDKGMRHDLVDAVFALGGQDDLVLIVRRVEALTDFLATDDGANLAAGYKRAVNILRIEEKKDKATYSGTPDTRFFDSDEEKALAAEIATARATASTAIDKEDFVGAMAALAKLRGPLDTFFDNVTVNAEDAKVRENRLKLLSEIRTALHAVADFSKIEG